MRNGRVDDCQIFRNILFQIVPRHESAGVVGLKVRELFLGQTISTKLKAGSIGIDPLTPVIRCCKDRRPHDAISRAIGIGFNGHGDAL